MDWRRCQDQGGHLAIQVPSSSRVMRNLKLIVVVFSMAAAYSCSGQTYFSTGNAPGGGRLYRSTDLCNPQLICVTPGVEYADLTVLTDRRLLGYRYVTTNLIPGGFYLIDTITGASSILYAMNGPGAIAMETESDSTVLFAIGFNYQLYRLNLTTLAISVVGYVGSYPGGDILLVGDDLFYTTASNALIRIELTPDHQSISQIIHIDWLGVDDVWGLALPSGFQDEHPDCIVAAAGQRLYALNTVTAEATELCDVNVAGSFYGAAAIRDNRPWNPSMDVRNSGPCAWQPQPSTLLVDAEGLGGVLRTYLPSTHKLLHWDVFDAAGRQIAGARGAALDDHGQFNHGWYILRAMVRDPCGREILVPGIRLRM